MESNKDERVVLITGCSDNSLGSALALALHAHGGHRVFATARNLQHIKSMTEAAIETLELDVLSKESVDAAVQFLLVTQAFLPLLLKRADPRSGDRKSIIVNNTSISSVLRTPYHSAYGASKAAMAAFNDMQRIELARLGICVVDLKTGSLESNFQENKTNAVDLPVDSTYHLIREDVLKVITGEKTEAYAEDRDVWNQ
ncbi:hypothetical protein KVT40_000780 [Elsinoe batatas]|uniref:Uncharacterized protein n=1 Tax=Elsinoe batatas TaxID=2601811 RepID=A0A8K0LA93_9PEZI|nr:hypothetical protein KVT40_000780 [Elsinoe batatas]